MDRKPFPPWLKKRVPSSEQMAKVWNLISFSKLHTICQSAHCPNLGECFSRGTATFLILGDTCTRNCRFCQVKKGKPLPVDENEPLRIREAVEKLVLQFVVVTSVTRDDLPDGGAGLFAEVIRELHKAGRKIEVLIPDFKGSRKAIETVIREKPEVFAHNLETVPRLYPIVRPQANYLRSLKVLETAKKLDPSQITKSGMMVGMGEKESEVIEVMKKAREKNVDIFTIGQYLPPTPGHYPLQEFVHPDVFEMYQKKGEEMGMVVLSGPWVRSSYQAEKVYQQTISKYSPFRRID